MLQKLNQYQKKAQSMIGELGDASLLTQQILLSCFATITDRKIPGSDVVDLLLSMKTSEEKSINKMLEVFLKQVRISNPSFFS